MPSVTRDWSPVVSCFLESSSHPERLSIQFLMTVSIICSISLTFSLWSFPNFCLVFCISVCKVLFSFSSWASLDSTELRSTLSAGAAAAVTGAVVFSVAVDISLVPCAAGHLIYGYHAHASHLPW